MRVWLLLSSRIPEFAAAMRVNLLSASAAAERGISGWPMGHEGAGTVVGVSYGEDAGLLGGQVAIESHAPFRQLWNEPWHKPEIAKDQYNIIGYQARDGKAIAGHPGQNISSCRWIT